MRHGQLHRRCLEVARTIDVPDPFDLSALLAALSGRRGRPVRLLRYPMPNGAPCGVCIATDRADYVVVTDAAAGTQHEHIALHEVAHLVLDHGADSLSHLVGELLQHLDLDGGRVRFARTGYSSHEELEAEYLASLLRQRAGLWAPPTGPGGITDERVARLARALEHG
jgi:hypothetical protein